MRPFSVPSIRNDKLIKSYGNSALAESALYDLTQIYLSIGLASMLASPSRDSGVDPVINPDYFPKTSRKELQLFTMLSLAMSLGGGLTKDDSRFVYDSIGQIFRPIFYDGHASRDIPTLKDSELAVPYDINSEHKRTLVNKLKSLDSKIIVQELSDLGATYSLNSIDKKIDAIIHNINGQRSTQIGSLTQANQININELMHSWVLGNNQQKQLFLIKLADNVFNKCLVKMNAILVCSSIDFRIDSLNLSRLLVSQQLNAVRADLKNAIYIDASGQKNDSSLHRIQPAELSNVEFMISSNLVLQISKENRTIRISRDQNSEYYGDSQVHIRGGSMTDWIVSIEPNILGYQPIPIDMKKSLSNHLSGCLTFSDIKLEKVSIIMSQSNCEDAVHFVRVSGVGVDLDVNQSLSDSVDADFSDIEFGNVKINGAGNDCVDLSAGGYVIRAATMANCADKGISVGEKSSVKVDELFINVAGIGVAGKDSSEVSLDRFSINDVDFCFAAYQKKVNYFGGIINLEKGECTDSHIAKVFKQKGSIVSSYKSLND
jgi:hypothetical protein